LPQRTHTSRRYSGDKYFMQVRDQFFLQLSGCFRKIAKRYYEIYNVSPSVRPLGTNRLPLDGFSWKPIFGYFSKTCQENSSFFKN
jgi:hypothetical protein